MAIFRVSCLPWLVPFAVCSDAMHEPVRSDWGKNSGTIRGRTGGREQPSGAADPTPPLSSKLGSWVPWQAHFDVAGVVPSCAWPWVDASRESWNQKAWSVAHVIYRRPFLSAWLCYSTARCTEFGRRDVLWSGSWTSWPPASQISEAFAETPRHTGGCDWLRSFLSPAIPFSKFSPLNASSCFVTSLSLSPHLLFIHARSRGEGRTHGSEKIV